MTVPRSWRHTLTLLVLLTLIIIPATTAGATTVRSFTASDYLAKKLSAPAPPPVTVGASAVFRLGAPPGYGAAGTQGSSVGLQGTTVVLPSCTAACTDRYRPASSAILAAGEYVERVSFAVTQPMRTGVAVGFDLEIAVHLTTGWVVGKGYLSTGVATGAAAATITLRIYLSLGNAAPTVTALEVVVNECTATTGCP